MSVNNLELDDKEGGDESSQGESDITEAGVASATLSSELEGLNLKHSSKFTFSNAAPLKKYRVKEGDSKDQLLRIFPSEIWEKILDVISDHGTLQILNNLSPLFRDILLARRVQFLFASFWGIFGRKYHEAAIVCTSGGAEVDEEPAGPRADNSQKTRWYTGILQLRLVCRTWCQEIDNNYQNHEIHYKMGGDQENQCDRKVETLVQDKFVTRSVRNMTRFELHFEATHYNSVDRIAIRNPFIGRAVCVSITQPHSPESGQFLNNLRNILFKYGKYVWHFRMAFDQSFTTWTEWYSAVKSILDLVPNLRSLRFQCLRSEKFGQRKSPEDLRQFVEFIRLNTLSAFQHLEFLKVDTVDMAPAFFTELIRSCGNVSIMDVNSYNRPHCVYQFSTEILRNLRKLSLTFHNTSDFEIFCAGDVNWPLTRLDMEFRTHASVNWSRLFGMLQDKWGNTLTTLRLNLPNVLDKDDDRNIALLDKYADLRLNLPHLTKLKLTMHSPSYLDFLLAMKDTLEMLEIRLYMQVENESQLELVNRAEYGKTIQLFCFADRPAESNIWAIFSKLKFVSVDYDIAAVFSLQSSSTSRCYRWQCTNEQARVAAGGICRPMSTPDDLVGRMELGGNSIKGRKLAKAKSETSQGIDRRIRMKGVAIPFSLFK